MKGMQIYKDCIHKSLKSPASLDLDLTRTHDRSEKDEVHCLSLMKVQRTLS